MKTAMELLVAARELISDPSRFDPSETARDAAGRACCASYWSARTWCSLGALWKFKPPRDVDFAACKLLRAAMGGDDIASFSLTRTHADVLAAFDRAIESAKNDS